MDRLDDIAAIADPLLRRVDDLLSATGAPADHPLWTELRRVRLLPADAVRAVVALRPAALADAGPHLRGQAREYADIAASLPAPGDWTGDAADMYDAGRRRVADQLSGDPESLAERLEASADLGEALAGWMRQARGSLALTLADVLGSAEAVTLARTPAAHPVPASEVLAAAGIAARVLGTVADAYDHAEDLLDGSTALTEPGPVDDDDPSRLRDPWIDAH